MWSEGLMVHASEHTHMHTYAHDLGTHRFLETQGLKKGFSHQLSPRLEFPASFS